MTNGEKVKAMFPSMIIGFITESQIGIYFVKNQHSATVFSLDWWNVEYKEPTTKNNLADDIISRNAVLKPYERLKDEDTISVWLIRKNIEQQPSVNQEPRWIPVSERLPEIQNSSDEYLVTLKRGGIYIATFTECNRKHWWTYDDVIAWMPLPKSYSEVKE